METLQKYREEILHYLMTFMGGFMGLYAICAHGSYGSAQTGNLMDLLIDVSDGNGFSAAARIGAFLIFSSGIAAAWLLHEFCTLPMRELCIVVDAAALMLSARLPEEVFAFFQSLPDLFCYQLPVGQLQPCGPVPQRDVVPDRKSEKLRHPLAEIFLLQGCAGPDRCTHLYADDRKLSSGRQSWLCCREYPRRSRSLLGFCAAGCGSAGALAGALRPAGSRRTL